MQRCVVIHTPSCNAEVRCDTYTVSFLGSIILFMGLCNRNQRVVVDGEVDSEMRSFKLEINFDWDTTRISIRTFIILNIYQ